MGQISATSQEPAAHPSDAERRRIERLCGLMEGRLDVFSEAVTQRIRAEIPSYARVPTTEHIQTIREQAGVLLAALAAGAEPTTEQLRSTQVAARRRAYYGVPVYDVLAAFHIVSRQLWDDLREASEGVKDADALVGLLGLLWTWMQSMSSVVADAYADEASMRHGREVSLRHRLLEALRSGGTMAEQAAEIARELGFDPDGEFQAACAPASAWPQEQIELLQRGLGHVRGVVQCGLRDQLMVALTQEVDSDEVASRMSRLAGASAVFGMGLTRRGLTGADASIADAERALWVARFEGAGMVRFEDVWLPATLSSSRDRLDPLLAAGRKVAREHPHLAVAVSAFARSGFTLAGAAEELTVHPNTVAYRLGRWQELTGWNPRLLPGLLLSVAALEVPAAGEEPQP